MTREDIAALAAGYIENAPDNRISPELALSPELAGMRIYDAPLFAFGDARDPMFETLRRPEAIGPHFMTPTEWLPEARTVVCFFLPFSQAVRAGNRRDMRWPSNEWLHARIEGQAFMRLLCEHLTRELRARGHACALPLTDARFTQALAEEVSREGRALRFTSNWSERHAAYVCGLGTFGLSKGLITVRGTAGRYGSLITSLALPPDARGYTDIYAYCTRCGACARNCPAQAISLAAGKDHVACSAFVASTQLRHHPRYGCGKCQVGVPCETRNPRAAAPTP